MSYLKYLKEQAEEWEIPFTIFRQLDAIMNSVMDMSHHLNPGTQLQILREIGYSRETLMRIAHDQLKFVFMRAMFLKCCEEQVVKPDYAYRYIDYWNTI